MVQCPRVIPALFTGTRHFVYGLNLGSALDFPESGELLVHAMPNSRKAEERMTMKVSFSKSSMTSAQCCLTPFLIVVLAEGKVVHQLAARARIRELELAETAKDAAKDLIKQEMVALGVKYNLASTHTRCVLVCRSCCDSSSALWPFSKTRWMAKRER